MRLRYYLLAFVVGVCVGLLLTGSGCGPAWRAYESTAFYRAMAAASAIVAPELTASVREACR